MITSSGIDTTHSSPTRTRSSAPPQLVPCWTTVCASSDLRPGKVIPFAFGNRPVAIFRGRDHGVVYALPAHCQHQGVDLTHGTVVGDRLRCPLHHWEYSDRCERIPGIEGPPRPTARPHYQVTERFGMIFLHPGSNAAMPPPGFSVEDRDLYFRSGPAVTVRCPWYVPVANAFDMVHLRTVHRRELKTEPVVSQPDPLTFHVQYATSVVGEGWSDRAMRLLSGNDIRVRITCIGTILRVEAFAGSRRSFLMVSLRPTPDGVSLLPLFGVPRTRSGGHLLHGRLAAALFTAFLTRDLYVLNGIRFPPGFIDSRDETLNACYRYLCQLPDYENE
jgi:nitrite reductase/ring-hydroxylating ferredoxin subunit